MRSGMLDVGCAMWEITSVNKSQITVHGSRIKNEEVTSEE